MTDQGPREFSQEGPGTTGITNQGSRGWTVGAPPDPDLPLQSGGGTPPPPPPPAGSSYPGPVPPAPPDPPRSVADMIRQPVGFIEHALLGLMLMGLVLVMAVAVGLIYGAGKFYLGDDRDPFAAPSAEVVQEFSCGDNMMTFQVVVPKGGNPTTVHFEGYDAHGVAMALDQVAREGHPVEKLFLFQGSGTDMRVPTGVFTLTDNGTGAVRRESLGAANSTECPAPTPEPKPTIEVHAQGRSTVEDIGTPGILGEVDSNGGYTVQQFFADGTPGGSVGKINTGDTFSANEPCGSVWVMNPAGEREAQLVVPDPVHCTEGASVAPSGQSAPILPSKAGGGNFHLACYDTGYASSNGGSYYVFEVASVAADSFTIFPKVAGYDGPVEWELTLDGMTYVDIDYTGSVTIPINIIKVPEGSRFVAVPKPMDDQIEFSSSPCIYDVKVSQVGS